jgi:hypothetical protein
VKTSHLARASMLLLAACADSSTNPNTPGAGSVPAPWGITVYPGPSYNAITVRWARINGAADNYLLYESTSPAATIATATKIDGVSSPAIRTELVTGQTYYYRFVARGNGGESAPSVVVAATATRDFILLPLSPAAGTALGTGDQLAISVRITSRYQLATVSATVGDRVVNLATDANGDWTATTPLAGLPTGATLLTFTARDVNGSSAQAAVRFDILPTFQVTLPPLYSVARPGIRVQASCAPVACYSIQVLVTSPASGYVNTPLVNVRGSLDQTVSLASLDGRAGELDFFMSDSLGASSYPPITVRGGA